MDSSDFWSLKAVIRLSDPQILINVNSSRTWRQWSQKAFFLPSGLFYFYKSHPPYFPSPFQPLNCEFHFLQKYMIVCEPIFLLIFRLQNKEEKGRWKVTGVEMELIVMSANRKKDCAVHQHQQQWSNNHVNHSKLGLIIRLKRVGLFYFE